MKIITLSISFIFLLLFTFHSATAQKVTGKVYQTEESSITTYTDIATYDQLFPADTTPKRRA